MSEVDYNTLYLAIAYVGVQTFTVKDVIRFLGKQKGRMKINMDCGYNWKQVEYAIKQMGCIRTHPGHYTCPWITKVSVIK